MSAIPHLVTRHRPLAFAAATAAALAASRAELRNSGTTCEERRRELPGEDIVPGARSTARMATTIAAPPSAVWPWLVQMGCDRAGWYSWDRLDNGGRPSAEKIVPEWQHVEVGDRWASTPDGRTWFEVAAVEPERLLVLRASLNLRAMRMYDTGGDPPAWYTDGYWTFVLEPLPKGGTRLFATTGSVSRPRLLNRLLDLVAGGPAHLIMQRRQFRNLKRRAERRGTS